ncbi:hypothetical protein Ocepr_2356 (plasmid) [Oceanithermus profundus DSM 14977]|uniref:DUF4900 domain-containing protein n=1 Tax=Oceanithermus profundus (strain DSM 14977 / NBRC 100410 / VKM B-2274 / 506) TaxID=670487 RepID=E4UAM5_OCEP5|nr:hypothetical protein [Oceanithermus profundus]ADR37804.1 hypothetical protein Ocepr_2356 [Oceanithermus profundus DSM 14977]
MNNARGSIMLVVLMLSLLFSAIAAFNLFVTTTRSQAVRLEQRTQALEAKARAQAHLLRGHVVTKLKHEVAAQTELNLGNGAYYLENKEADLASALQQVADGLYCDWVEGTRMRVAFTNEACGEPLPPGVTPPRLPYLIGGAANTFVSGPFGIGGTYYYYPQVYAIPYVALVEAKDAEGEAVAVFKGYFEAHVSVPNPMHFSTYIEDPPTSGLVAFGNNDLIEGAVAVPGPVRFDGEPLLLGTVFVHSNPTGEVSFAGVRLQENKIVNPQAPCYPGACPRLTSGADWSAPFTPPPLSNYYRAPSGALEFSGDVDRIRMRYNGSDGRHYLYVKQGATETQYRFTIGGALESSTDGGATWTEEQANFNGRIYVRGDLRGLEPVDAFEPALDGPVSIFTDGDLTVTGPLLYNNTPCQRYSDPDSNTIYSQCDTTVDDQLTLVSLGGNVLLDVPPGHSWKLAANLVAVQGVVKPSSYSAPPATLDLLGTIAAKRYAPWGFDDADGRRITGVVLHHYFDSREARGATLRSALFPITGTAAQVIGIVPHSEAPKIVRE